VRGKGTSIKAAEMMAANLALKKLNKASGRNVKKG
jgi:dsRNA-specific ribonuclease